MLDYPLRAVTSADYAELSDLFSRVFGQDRTLDEWRWKFMASRERCSGSRLPDSLVALDSRGRIVAHAGILMLPGWFRGASIPFVQVCDVMVDPAHRGGLGQANLFTLLLRALLDQVAGLLPNAFGYGFPGERPYRLGERAGVYSRLETALEVRIRRERRMMELWRAVPLSWYDPALDSLWRRRRHGYALCLVRDGGYLRWRYADHPNRSYALLGIHVFGRLMGWAVTQGDADAMRVVDVLAPRWLLRPMLRTLVSRLESGDGATLWLPGGWREAVAESWQPTPVVTSLMCRRSCFEREISLESLYYTMGDVDIF